jgi:raffinose/stachyose/melibiose transport system substrate-binding protein
MNTFLRSALFVGASVAGLASSAQAQEIKLWTLTFANDSANKAFQSIIDDFQKLNPGITVKVEQRATDEHKSALRVAANSDQAPEGSAWAGSSSSPASLPT